MKIALASDHGGFGLKEIIKKHLESINIEVTDFGTNSLDACDYADYAVLVAENIMLQKFDKGILICGTGIGMSIAANKVKGIRAASCSDSFSSRLCVEHNNANILCLGERVIGKGLALDIIDSFLCSDFEGDRHQRRIDKISAIENK